MTQKERGSLPKLYKATAATARLTRGDVSAATPCSSNFYKEKNTLFFFFFLVEFHDEEGYTVLKNQFSKRRKQLK